MPFEYLVEGKEVIYKTLNSHDFMGDPTVVMFRRSNLYVGGFKDKLWIVDWDMWIRHLLIGDAYFIPEVLTYIRKHPNQVTNAVVKKNFTHHFAEYEFYKSIKEKNEYGLDLSRIDLDNIIKTKAKKCTKDIVYKNFHQLVKKDKKITFKKALKIAAKERVFISSLMDLIENSFKHLSPEYRTKSALMKKRNFGLPH